ncbi:metallophosphoesterase [Pleionea sp. CnH1-48]|uniref:DUF7910 domain-containing protein n=1 Tax=Pleionea sp. CnH1-48 TaxID=2954494 RepID=UPI002096FFB0|nr:metallophosphoesterase [Pleionea sp. CnH1-48]MCO7224371.1 metallophosphoesterase [Pleionea sp. CnH1-48]
MVKLLSTFKYLASIFIIFLSQNALSVTLYQHGNYGGYAVTLTPGDYDIQALLARGMRNDDVSSIKIPDGFMVIAYQHGDFKGWELPLNKNTPWVGNSYNDQLSSIRVVPCLKFYVDAGYRGAVQQVCSYGKGNVRFNNNISSIKVPKGHKVKMCDNAIGQPAYCRTYFEDIRNVGNMVNDAYTSYEFSQFNKNDFTMVFASDPQIGFCISKTCLDGPGSSEVANQWHIESIRRHRESVGTDHFAGIVINGDITNIGNYKQFKKYNWHWETDNRFNIYPGLGNHDYKNYARDRKGRAAEYLDIFTDRFGSIPTEHFDHRSNDSILNNRHDGSLAYSFEIGDYHFVQLHQNPAYSVTIDPTLYEMTTQTYGRRQKVHHFHINQSLNWLDDNLLQAKGKTVVLNMHALMAGDGLYNGHPDWTRFIRILDKHPQVKMIFAGHLHDLIGSDRREYYDSEGTYHPPKSMDYKITLPSGRKVPVFFNGSAMTSRYLSVRFLPSKVEMTTINSENHNVQVVGTETLEFVKPEYEKVAIKTLKGYYFRAENGGGANVRADRLSARTHERFQLIPLPNNQVAFKTSEGYYLSARDNGNLMANVKVIGPWEKFKIEGIGNGQVAIKVHTGRYFSARSNGNDNVSSDATKNEPGWYALDIMCVQHCNAQSYSERVFPRVSIRNSHNKYLRAENGGGGNVKADRTSARSHEIYTMVSYLDKNGQGKVGFMTHNRHFLKADRNSYYLDARSKNLSHWEFFRREHLGGNRYRLKTAHHWNGRNRYVVDRGTNVKIDGTDSDGGIIAFDIITR